MGLLLAALCKHILLPPSHRISPTLAALICPYVLRVFFSPGIIGRGYVDLLYASRLFFFQLGHIVSDAEPGQANESRWQRAVRLVCQWVNRVRRSPASQLDEDSFHSLTILSL
ncbi:hypothetical protein SLE2022_089760 [Rubroshorea leprosula]